MKSVQPWADLAVGLALLGGFAALGAYSWRRFLVVQAEEGSGRNSRRLKLLWWLAGPHVVFIVMIVLVAALARG